MSSMLLMFAGQAAPSKVVVDRNAMPITDKNGNYIVSV